MSADTLAPADPRLAVMQRTWIDCLRAVLGQVAGFPITVEPANQQEFAAAEAAGDQPAVWMSFAASKALKGEMAILTNENEAVPLAQLLVSEPPDASVSFDKDRRDAYEELLRQVVGQVSTNLKGVAKGEVEIKPLGNEVPQWKSTALYGIRITGEKFPAVHLTLLVSPELAKSLNPEPEVSVPSVAAEEHSAQPATELSAARSSNLELLLDVKLDATIRFGEKHMLLRDILELHPGTAVALDRQVDEPVELLVGGRMVARGEVVIVDGNYGLRITEILSPQQRIESLRPGQ